MAEAKKKENEDEKVKAEEKKVSKKVEEDASHNFDNKDDKNIDNLIFDQVMTGYYAEMKDPKNADKTVAIGIWILNKLFFLKQES